MATITRESAEIKSFITGFLSDAAHDNQSSDSLLANVFRIALASLEAEPVAWKATFTQIDHEYNTFTAMYSDKAEAERWGRLHKVGDFRVEITPLYTAPPAPVVPDDWQLVPKKITLEMECALSKADSYEIGWLWALAAAPKYEVQNAKRVQNALNACRADMLQGVEPASNHEELSEENGSSLQLRNLIRQRHAEWSDKTFGCVGPVGPLKHLSKEALEAAAEPDDLSEWADMQFLLWDAQRRAGISDAEITAAMGSTWSASGLSQKMVNLACTLKNTATLR